MLTLPSPKPLMTSPRVSRLLLMGHSVHLSFNPNPQLKSSFFVLCAAQQGGVWPTLPSPKPLMTFPRVSRLLLIALPSVCLSLLSPSSLAASVLRSLPARSTKFSVETCKEKLRFFEKEKKRLCLLA